MLNVRCASVVNDPVVRLMSLIFLHCRFERFNSIVSDLKVFQQKSRSAVKMHNMLKTNIESKCMSDLDDMIEEAGFPEKFQQLSQIVEQNAPYVGEKAWLVHTKIPSSFNEGKAMLSVLDLT